MQDRSDTNRGDNCEGDAVASEAERAARQWDHERSNAMPAPIDRNLGEGILTWMPAERELGRWGSVSLRIDGNEFAVFRDLPVGMQVRLSATVLQVRHVVLPPDPTRGLQASTPHVGERIELGSGLLFAPDLAGLNAPIAVGIAPPPGQWRAHQWLSPTALYRAHNHRVRLEIRPYPDLDGHLTASAAPQH